MSDQKDVNLLLVGRTGNGKSATGNSILGQKLFSSSMNSEPFTEADIRLGRRADGHPHIYVVDGPGIGDSSLDDPKGVKTTISLTETAFQRLAEFSNGFNAVLLVLKYGERFTTQEKDAVRMLKGILGSRVLENHGVVVMTRGDNFEIDQEEDGLCFEDWCRRQTGEVAAIFQECKGRIVLFDNRTKTETKLEKQREELLKHVERLGRYTKQDYDKAEEDRRRLTLASEFDTREKKTMAFVDKTTAEINKLDISGNPNDAEKKIIVLQDKLNAHRQELQEETQGTDMATRLQLPLDILSLSLGNKLEMASRTLELQERATQNRRQRENDSSKGSKNKKKKNKQSDDVEVCSSNDDRRAPSSRNLPSIRKDKQREGQNKPRGRKAGGDHSDDTIRQQHNPLRIQSNHQDGSSQPHSDSTIDISDRKQKHCCSVQ